MFLIACGGTESFDNQMTPGSLHTRLIDVLATAWTTARPGMTEEAAKTHVEEGLGAWAHSVENSGTLVGTTVLSGVAGLSDIFTDKTYCYRELFQGVKEHQKAAKAATRGDDSEEDKSEDSEDGTDKGKNDSDTSTDDDGSAGAVNPGAGNPGAGNTGAGNSGADDKDDVRNSGSEDDDSSDVVGGIGTPAGKDDRGAAGGRTGTAARSLIESEALGPGGNDSSASVPPETLEEAQQRIAAAKVAPAHGWGQGEPNQRAFLARTLQDDAMRTTAVADSLNYALTQDSRNPKYDELRDMLLLVRTVDGFKEITECATALYQLVDGEEQFASALQEAAETVQDCDLGESSANADADPSGDDPSSTSKEVRDTGAAAETSTLDADVDGLGLNPGLNRGASEDADPSQVEDSQVGPSATPEAQARSEGENSDGKKAEGENSDSEKSASPIVRRRGRTAPPPRKQPRRGNN